MLTVLLSFALAGGGCQPSVSDDLSGTRNGLGTDGGILFLGDAGPLDLDSGIAGNPEWRSGVYESLPLDVRGLTSSESVSWKTQRPSGLPLPDDGGTESFTRDSVTMRDNVLLLHFEDSVWTGAPNEVRDSSGLGNHGTTDGGATVGAGLLGKGASFDGDACLTVNDAPSLRPAAGLTVSLWFYPRLVDGSAQGLASSRFDYQDRSAWTLYLWSNSHLWVDLDMEDDRHEGSIAITQDRWHHAAIVYDGNLPIGVRARLFVDGQLDSTFQETSASIPAYGAPVTVGCLPNPMASIKQGFLGEIDEVAMFTRPLSLEEVTSIYRRGASRVRGRARGCTDATCSTNPPWPGTFLSDGGGTISLTSPYVQVQLELVGDGSGQPWPEVEKLQILAPAGPCVSDAGVDAGVEDAGHDAGTEDAGTQDAGVTEPVDDAGVQSSHHTAIVSCGCDALSISPMLLLLFSWSRRRTR